MTDTTPEPDDNEGDLSVNIVLYPADAAEKAIRQLGYGLSPFVLIEPEVNGEDVVIKFVGSHIDTTEELLETLETFVGTLRDVLEQQTAAQA